MESDGWLEIMFTNPDGSLIKADKDHAIPVTTITIEAPITRNHNWNLIGATILQLRKPLGQEVFNTWADICWPFVGYNEQLWKVTEGK